MVRKRLTLPQAQAVIKRAGFNSADLITLAIAEIGVELNKVFNKMQKEFGSEKKEIDLSFSKFVEIGGKTGYNLLRTLKVLDDLNEAVGQCESLQSFRVFIPDLKRFVEAMDAKENDEKAKD